MLGISTNSLSNIILSGYTQLNQVRLANALSGPSGSKIPAVQSMSSLNGLNTQDADFLKSYEKHLRELQDLSQQVLEGGAQQNPLAAGATDASVAEASGTLQAASDSYTLTVQQLARGQVNRSSALQASSPMPSMGGALRLQTSKGNFEIRLSAAGADDNRQMLEQFASRINGLEAGVQASVVEEQGSVFLQLEGAASENGSFAVSGSLAERLGLNQVYQQAQQAVYTVSKNGGESRQFFSASNQVELADGLQATLKATGTTQIQAGAGAASQIADALSSLVDQYNQTYQFLERNADYGIGVLNQMKRMLTPPTSEGSMALIGITAKATGGLAFDRGAFLQKMAESPELAQDITANFAQGIRMDADAGLRARSGDLLGSLQDSRWTATADGQRDTFSFLNMYNRSGVYNLANYYAVGLLMNLNA